MLASFIGAKWHFQQHVRYKYNMKVSFIGVLDPTFNDVYPGIPASSTTKSGRHDIAEILMKVALNTIKSINQNQ
jgi:hypothetical protein